MIVIPMAGVSRRFSEAGYTKPKYQLEAHGVSLFEYAVRSFQTYFETVPFVFVYRDVADSDAFVRASCAHLGIRTAHFVSLDRTTSGQAETVFVGLQAVAGAQHEPVTVFNIDTFRPGFTFPDFLASDRDAAGYLEVFEGTGDGWSFVKPDPADPDYVIETAEKRPISNLCCTGLYHFNRGSDFLWAYENPPQMCGAAEQKERYVAPLYNALIARKQKIRYQLIGSDEVVFCGVPAEYDEVLSSPVLRARLAGAAM